MGSWPGETVKSKKKERLLRRTRETSEDVIWAEHVVSDYLWKKEHRFLKGQQPEAEALKQLDSLSNRPEWWVRYYVAEILQQHRHSKLYNSEIMERLQKDDHPLVRDRIKSPKQ